jgi:phosphoribosyl-ATP pyrophosphohydrolase
MAELTQLESKLAEVIGLAQAAQDATGKIARMVEDDGVKKTLERMGEEAKETEERGTKVAEQLDGKKTALLEKARETKAEAKEMMDTYLGDDADALDGLEFLIMAEAGELGHTEIVNKMNEQAGDEQIGEVAEWALGVQRRHFEQVRECALTLAAAEDPNEPEG